MGKQGNYFVVGLFVLGTLAAGIGLALQLGGEHVDDNPSHYRLLFYRDTSGLSVGADVNYLGVTVGSVHSIRLTRSERTGVEVLIDIDRSTPVSQATFASLAYQGVTGLAVINLSDDAGGNAIPIAREGEDAMTIPTRDSGLTALLAEGPGLGSSMRELLERANALLSDDNLARLENTLENLAQVSEAVAEQEQSLAAIPQDLSRFLSRADRIAERIDGLAVSLAPQFEATAEQLRNGTRDLAEASTQLRAWLEAHEETLDRAASEGLAQLPELVDETRSTLSAIERFADRLERNPSRILYRRQLDEKVVDP
ncbi:MAG: MlaD family protein [Pseudomonadota bacterium]